jgi:hypothetical protein
VFGGVISMDQRNASPADLLRERLTHGRGRIAVIATTTVWIMDLLLANHLEQDQVIDRSPD